MGDRLERVIHGVERLFQELSVNVREERVLRYIVTELQKGRHFDEIMADPYIVNNTDSDDRARILETPTALVGIEDQLEAEFADYRRQVTGPRDDG